MLAAARFCTAKIAAKVYLITQATISRRTYCGNSKEDEPECDAYNPTKVFIDECPDIFHYRVGCGEHLGKFADAFAHCDGNKAHKDHGNDHSARTGEFKGLAILVEYATSNDSTQYYELEKAWSIVKELRYGR